MGLLLAKRAGGSAEETHMPGGEDGGYDPHSRGNAGFKRILVAVDGSQDSMKAVQMATEMARSYQASLTVLNVVMLPSSFFMGEHPPPRLQDSRKASRIEHRRP